MNLIFHIFQGIGIAAAVGIRPFLPTLAVGALAAGNVAIDFSHTDYSFLESPGFLLVIVVLAILLSLAERQLGASRVERRPGSYALAACALILGALLFAGALAHGHRHELAWPGWPAGMICALIGMAATVPLLARVRRRLDTAAATAVPLYAEGTGLLLAVLAVLAPPVGLIGLALLVWLLLAGRRRADQKYAGLRILR